MTLREGAVARVSEAAGAVPRRDVVAWRDVYVAGGDIRVYPPSAVAAADTRTVAAYLDTLIDWLNEDPWPTDGRMNGPRLTPAAIERRLRISVKGPKTEDVAEKTEDVAADELADSCDRLVIRGGPGSGKTWLAKRIARRCAERARDALAAGTDLADVELPLYTTCSLLAQAVGDIRDAVISSALDYLPDLGAGTTTDELHAFFRDRPARVLLVLDSLDEASAPDSRIRQADTLRQWRLVLTSRPGSWNQQLKIAEGNLRQQEGDLLPLSYPEDVTAFIARWFAGPAERPGELSEKARVLIGEIDRRPGLQQAATVPLVLAFYCIVAGGAPLPQTRHELYDLVVKRLLTGLWRKDGPRPDVTACLQVLEEWAWAAACRDPVSGTGTWNDEFRTAAEHPDQAVRDAVAHIAVPLGLADIDTGQTARRFIHRSIREHMVARYLSGRPVAEVAGELLNHLWYDPDWEYAAPMALAMHPARDEILERLLRAATGSADGVGLTADACFEVRRFLSEVAIESAEEDWAPEFAEIIAAARRDIALRSLYRYVRPAPGWARRDGQVKNELLDEMAAGRDHWAVMKPFARLAPGPGEKALARQSLLVLLRDGAAAREDAWDIVYEFVDLDPDAADLREARRYLRSTMEEAEDIRLAYDLVRAVERLEPDLAERRWYREKVLGLTPVTDHERTEIVFMLASLVADQSEREVALGFASCVSFSRIDGLRMGLPGLIESMAPEGEALEALVRHVIGTANRPDGHVDAEGLVNYSSEYCWGTESPLFERVMLDIAEAVNDAGLALEIIDALERSGTNGKAIQDRMRRLVTARLTGIRDTESMLAQALEVVGLCGPPEEGAAIADAACTLLGITELLRDRGDEHLIAGTTPNLRPGGGLAAELMAFLDWVLAEIGSEIVPMGADILSCAQGAAVTVCVRAIESAAGGSPAKEDDATLCRRSVLGIVAQACDMREAQDAAWIARNVPLAPRDRAEATRRLLELARTLPPDRDTPGLLKILAEDCPESLRPELRRLIVGSLAATTDVRVACDLVAALDGLAMTATERGRARAALLGALADPLFGLRASGSRLPGQLARAISAVMLRPDELGPVLAALQIMVRASEPGLDFREERVTGLRELASAATELAGSTDAAEPGRRDLLEFLDHTSNPATTAWATAVLVALRPSNGELERARRRIVEIFKESHAGAVHTRDTFLLETALSHLRPDAVTLRELHVMWRSFKRDMLIAVRRNSLLADWLAILPTFRGLARDDA